MSNKLTENLPNGFKVHTAELLKEIADCGLDRNMGVLKVPLNIFRKYLIDIAERSAELDDPILNEIMINMTLYEESDPKSKDFDKQVIEDVYKRATEYRKNQTK